MQVPATEKNTIVKTKRAEKIQKRLLEANNFVLSAKAVIIGHAVGDALGVPVEFTDREVLEKNPVTDMLGYGTYPVPKGAWSDDTSMSICTLDALGKYGLDCDRIMVNFGKWYYNDEFTPTGEMFDVGNTCSYAIDNYFAYHKPVEECGLTGEHSNGNGSLMRIHPVVLYLANKDLTIADKMEVIHIVSALTHAHDRSKNRVWNICFCLMGAAEKSVIRGYKGRVSKS